ncbi:hypothetical protein PsorP6_004929 [Peronosclerospora sorghi]|uniref:Uncharacterized protein n=1 Tax=Peronosclerospora sorghi TaxID=230839 RepID=A0ACC0W5N7_9STRA|nr:hypothetical protein PsorP6_004929 [Peronosclerospora sorghi]
MHVRRQAHPDRRCQPAAFLHRFRKPPPPGNRRLNGLGRATFHGHVTTLHARTVNFRHFTPKCYDRPSGFRLVLKGIRDGIFLPNGWQRTYSNMRQLAEKCCRHWEAWKLNGGTGEELFARGLPDNRQIWSATALLDEQHHRLLRDVHTSFLAAGSDYITCNNYGVTPGVGFSDEEIVRYTTIAGRVAREACDEWTLTSSDTTRPKPKVCGSLPPLLESYRADKVPEHNEGVRCYAMIAATLEPFVDCYLAETLSSVEEARMALLGVQGASGDTQKSAEVMVSFTLNSRGQLRSGENVCEAAQELIRFTESISKAELRGILFNCSQPEAVCKALHELHADENLQTSLCSRRVRLGAYANRLTVIPDNWALAESSEPQAMRTDLSVQQYMEFVSKWLDLGATIIGGCCGIGPEYISSVHSMLQNRGLR